MNRNIFIVCVCGLLMVLMIVPCMAAEEKHDFGDLHLAEQWSGDFDGMQERRVIRVLVAYNKMLYFVDQGQYRGVNIDFFTAFAKHLSEKYKRGVLKAEVLFLPVKRDQLLPALADGRGDIAAANLTITQERKELVDFSAPLLTGVKEIIITAPGVEGINSLEDLAGKEIHLRKSSSYYQHILQLNEKFINQGLQPVTVIAVDEFLEDSDLLEMVNADLIPIVAVDDHKAQFWGQIFENISLHPEIAIHSGGEIGWAIRKNSPKLAAEINEFLKTAKKGTLLGNIVYKKYLRNNKWARNALDKESQKRYQAVTDLFKKYSDMYDFDFLMTAALAYQESQLDHSKKSHVGAVGIMQLLPSTAADKNVGIPELEILENNVHAGHKYLRFVQDRYFSSPEISILDKYLMSFAAYNAGPAKINKLRREAASRGLDPNVWFQNVEVVVADRIGRETVQYVANIYKYFISYKLSIGLKGKDASIIQ